MRSAACRRRILCRRCLWTASTRESFSAAITLPSAHGRPAMSNGCGSSANRWASASILCRWRSTTARRYPRPASALRWRRAVWRTPTRCSAQPYAIDWPVVHGKGIGGGLLGTPTLNQNYPAAALQPCAGVYLTRIFLDGQWRPAATGIGKRPTVDSSADAAVTCETFVPDYAEDIYGRQPVLEFHKYFCPVRKFNSLEELAALIHRAADESKAYFAGKNATK